MIFSTLSHVLAHSAKVKTRYSLTSGDKDTLPRHELGVHEERSNLGVVVPGLVEDVLQCLCPDISDHWWIPQCTDHVP